MKLKASTIIFLIITLIVTASTCGIFAYLSDNESAINKLTIGNNNTEIIEVFEEPEKIQPGDSIKKEVAVKNNGSMPCYVRVALMISNKDMKENITLIINDSDWVAKSDGYYYYTKELPVNETTPNLLSSVNVSTSINNANIDNFKITVYSESIQKGYFSNYIDAWNAF